MVLIKLFQFVSIWSLSIQNEIHCNCFSTSLFHFVSTITARNEIKKNQNEKNYYILSKRVVTMKGFESNNARL